MEESAALSELELESLVGRLIGPGHPEPMGVYALRADRPEAAVALHLEQAVFYEAFGNTPELLAEEYDPYAASSVLLCVVDHLRRRPAGMMRIIVPSAAGHKSVHDIEKVWGESFEDLCGRLDYVYNPDTLWDIATLAVAPDYRSAALSGLVGIGLVQAVGIIGLRCGVTHMVTIMHRPVLRMFQWKLHRPFQPFPGVLPMAYLDSPASVPVMGDVADWHRRLSVEDEAMYQVMARGTGLEPVIRPPDWDTAQSVFSAVTRLNGPPLRLL
jgi:Acetyltransferase (GNAT) domain